jgi:ATP/maltotriose-dependent transcriptional regulator MalT
MQRPRSRVHPSSLPAKITPPTLAAVFPRTRLFRVLDRARTPVVDHRPPGAGKTTLVASYLAARHLPMLWYQVDTGDADPATFFYYLGVAAKRGRSPTSDGPSALDSGVPPELSTFTTVYAHAV